MSVYGKMGLKERGSIHVGVPVRALTMQQIQPAQRTKTPSQSTDLMISILPGKDGKRLVYICRDKLDLTAIKQVMPVTKILNKTASPSRCR
jgi:hypothetical protein